jgi:hypothetical protein
LDQVSPGAYTSRRLAIASSRSACRSSPAVDSSSATGQEWWFGIVGNRPDRVRCRSVEIDRSTFAVDVPNVPSRRAQSFLNVHIDRHEATSGAERVFASLNVRSLVNRMDDLREVRRDESVDVLFLEETWHNIDSICVCRLRFEGFQVVDRP